MRHEIIPLRFKSQPSAHAIKTALMADAHSILTLHGMKKFAQKKINIYRLLERNKNHEQNKRDPLSKIRGGSGSEVWKSTYCGMQTCSMQQP
jgi:hypothetical protein